MERHIDLMFGDEVMSDGNGRRGVVMCCGMIFLRWNMTWQLVAARYRMAVGFCCIFSLSRVQDRRQRAVVGLLGVLQVFVCVVE